VTAQDGNKDAEIERLRAELETMRAGVVKHKASVARILAALAATDSPIPKHEVHWTVLTGKQEGQ